MPFGARKNSPSLENKIAGTIGPNMFNEPIRVVKPPKVPNTKKWQAIIKSLDHSKTTPETTINRILAQYRKDNPGSSIGTQHYTILMHKKHIKFVNGFIKLVPGGRAQYTKPDLDIPSTLVVPRAQSNIMSASVAAAMQPDSPQKAAKAAIDGLKSATRALIAEARNIGLSDGMIRRLLRDELENG